MLVLSTSQNSWHMEGFLVAVKICWFIAYIFLLKNPAHGEKSKQQFVFTASHILLKCPSISCKSSESPTINRAIAQHTEGSGGSVPALRNKAGVEVTFICPPQGWRQAEGNVRRKSQEAIKSRPCRDASLIAWVCSGEVAWMPEIEVAPGWPSWMIFFLLQPA